jgi:hypothetical protein
MTSSIRVFFMRINQERITAMSNGVGSGWFGCNKLYSERGLGDESLVMKDNKFYAGGHRNAANGLIQPTLERSRQGLQNLDSGSFLSLGTSDKSEYDGP